MKNNENQELFFIDSQKRGKYVVSMKKLSSDIEQVTSLDHPDLRSPGRGGLQRQGKRRERSGTDPYARTGLSDRAGDLRYARGRLLPRLQAGAGAACRDPTAARRTRRRPC